MNRNRAVLLAAVAVVALAALGQAARAAEFTDVPKYHWAWRYVRGVSDAQIANGYPGTTTYKPDVVVTRDQMGVYVARGLAGGDDHVPSGPAEATFSDVAPGTWDYDYVEYCADPARDVVRGFGGSSPESPKPLSVAASPTRHRPRQAHPDGWRIAAERDAPVDATAQFVQLPPRARV